MAKLALINRNEKRRKVVKKYAAKRAELEAIARGGTLPELDEAEAGGTEASRRLLGEYETPQR